MTVRLYTNSGGSFPAGTRTQIASQEVFLADQSFTLVTVPLVASVPAGTTELVMEVYTPNGQLTFAHFFIGSNNLGQTGIGYLSAEACGAATPTNLATLGFPNMDIILNVNGACATPTPSTTPTNTIMGTVGQCTTAGPSGIALAGATMTLTGSSTGSTTTDGSGNYTLTGFNGGTYTVTPTKAARLPLSAGINTTDVIAIQRHFLLLGTPLSGCRLAAADPAAPFGTITTGDVIATQRFFLGFSTGIGNTGKYQFNPVNRSYSPLTTNQVAQNFDAIVFGDVATPFANPRPGGPDPEAVGTSLSAVASVSLPEMAADQSKSNFTAEVKTSAIDPNSNLVGFQGDFTFDERVVTFESQPVQPAGLTAGNWNVSGNVLPGAGPIRTLRVSAYSNDFKPLSGAGTLFELRMTRVSDTAQGTQLIWASSPDQFIFIDADLNTRTVGNAAPGRITTNR